MTSMPKTRSEQLSESFCELRGIRCRRVAEGTVPTPDYDIFVPRRKIVVEVKEFTINKEEQRDEQR
jgi:hypothetical protein